MKNCEEMVNSLFERKDRYVAEQKKKRAVITRAVASVCCFSLVALLGFGLWQGGMFDTTPSATINNSISANEKDDVVPSTNEKGDVVVNEKVTISWFDVAGEVSPSYATPKNSEYCFSASLQGAMNEYGDEVLYRVVIDVFENDEPLTDSSKMQAECDRLANLGYDASNGNYFTMTATYEELVDFVANESYGYFMFLYDERVA